MKSGSEHYTAAEDLMAIADQHDHDDEPARRAAALAQAQVHATLALAGVVGSFYTHMTKARKGSPPSRSKLLDGLPNPPAPPGGPGG